MKFLVTPKIYSKIENVPGYYIEYNIVHIKNEFGIDLKHVVSGKIYKEISKEEFDLISERIRVPNKEFIEPIKNVSIFDHETFIPRQIYLQEVYLEQIVPEVL